MRKFLIGLVAAVLLAGCGGGNAASTGPMGEAEDGIMQGTFGEPFDYGDGLVITASGPFLYDPVDEYGRGDGVSHPDHVRVDVTIENRTGEPFDPSMLTTSAASGGTDAVEIFDQNVGDGLATTIVDGGLSSFAIAYSVADPADVTLDVRPDFDRPKIVFTAK